MRFSDITFIIAQILSLVSSVFFTISIVQKTKKDLISFQVINTFCGVVSTGLLMSFGASVANAMALLRSLVLRGGNKTTKAQKRFLFMLAGLTLYVGVRFSTRSVIGLLPPIASAAYSICFIFCKNLKQLKVATLINVILWAVHDWTIQLYPAAISDTVNIVLLVVELIRYRNDPKYSEGFSQGIKIMGSINSPNGVTSIEESQGLEDEDSGYNAGAAGWIGTKLAAGVSDVFEGIYNKSEDKRIQAESQHREAEENTETLNGQHAETELLISTPIESKNISGSIVDSPVTLESTSDSLYTDIEPIAPISDSLDDPIYSRMDNSNSKE